MNVKPFVRIIKRGQLAAKTEPATSAAQPPQQSAESSARAIKATVSTWVKDFQQRRRVDAKLAFNNLFKEPLPRPSGT